MKTYAETKGEKPFDWNAFLKKGDYTTEELREADGLSQEWVTCACGNQCDAIPRNEFDGGSPTDHRLWNLGKEFADHIGFMYECSLCGNIGAQEARFDAIKTLLAIEKRSAEILAELKKFLVSVSRIEQHYCFVIPALSFDVETYEHAVFGKNTPLVWMKDFTVIFAIHWLKWNIGITFFYGSKNS